jgi:hypothetical protein
MRGTSFMRTLLVFHIARNDIEIASQKPRRQRLKWLCGFVGLSRKQREYVESKPPVISHPQFSTGSPDSASSRRHWLSREAFATDEVKAI